MEPLAYNPASELLVIYYNPVRTKHKHSRAVARRDVSWLPPGVVGVGGQGVETEGECLDIKLELSSVKESRGSRAGHENGVCQTRSCMICFN